MNSREGQWFIAVATKSWRLTMVVLPLFVICG
jgi:hypothetical protein